MAFSLNFSLREKILFVILVLIIIYALSFLVIFPPLREEIEKLRIESVNKERQVIIETAMAQKVPDLQQLYEEVKYIEAEVNYLNLSSENFLELIQETSKSSNVDLITFIPEENAETLTLNITVTGYYSEINQFLVSLKRLANQIDVIYLSLTPLEHELELKMILNRATSEGGNQV
ncbi:MAG: hypothetical protein ACOCQB_01430 [Halanaerobiaceae bacterium]